jgi:hypothetical protein
MISLNKFRCSLKAIKVLIPELKYETVKDLPENVLKTFVFKVTIKVKKAQPQ